MAVELSKLASAQAPASLQSMSTESRAVDHSAERPIVGDYAKVPLEICGGCLGSLFMTLLTMGLIVQAVVIVMVWLKGEETYFVWPVTGPGIEEQLFYGLAWLAWLINRERPATPLAFGITTLFLFAIVVMLASHQLFTIHSPPWQADKMVPTANGLVTGLAFAFALWFAISPRNRCYHRLSSGHQR